MNYWNSFPMLRLIIPLIGGVITGAFILESVIPSLSDLLVGSVLLVGFLGIMLLISRDGRSPLRFGLFLTLAFYIFGIFLTVSVSDHIYPDHFKQAESDGSLKVYLAEIVDEPQVKEKSIKIVARLTDSKNERFGKVLLYIKKDSVSTQLKYGNQLLLRTVLQTVVGQGNPNEFNYARYLRFHHIGHRAYVGETDWKLLTLGEPKIVGVFLSLRAKLIGLMSEARLSGNELAVASALVLGHRADIDAELLTAYAGSGATHVLSVSGLHVGIVFVIFSAMLKFLDRGKSGRIIRALLLVLLLFGYAALTGLSPSVLRATAMFSFVAIGKAIDRDTNIYNTLAVSAFLLILYDPLILMQVGFQLSYAAVFGIVLIQPRLFALLSFKNKIADWVWSISCVSIAAQIPTFPLGLLYFHQFPNLFLFSNLLVIPAAALILYLGFLLFIFSFWEPTLLYFGFLLKWLIVGLNTVVVWIEKVPYAVLSGIDLSIAETIMIYGVVVGILAFVIQKKSMGLYVSLMLSIVFLTMQIMEFHKQRTQKFLTAYNVKGETVIALVHGSEVTLIAGEQFWRNEQAMLFNVRHHWWNKGIYKENFVTLNDSTVNRRIEWDGKSFVILDLPKSKKPGSWTLTNDSLDVAFVHQVGWKNLEVLQKVNAKQFIISNTIGDGTVKELSKHQPNSIVQVSQAGAFTSEQLPLNSKQPNRLN